MKRTDPQLVADIIEKVVTDSGNRQQILEHRAAYLWVEVAGPAVNRYTFRRYVEKGVLHVYISSASLKNELSFHRSNLCEAINKALGENVLQEIQLH